MPRSRHLSRESDAVISPAGSGSSNIMKLLKVCRKVRICKLETNQSKLIKKLLEINRELEERQYISQNNKDEFESVFTFGPEQVTRNPLD